MGAHLSFSPKAPTLVRRPITSPKARKSEGLLVRRFVSQKINCILPNIATKTLITHL